MFYISVEKKSKYATIHRTREATQQGRPQGDAWISKRRGNRSNVLVGLGECGHWNLTDWLRGMDGGEEWLERCLEG